MSALQRTMITVQPDDYLSGQTEELEELEDLAGSSDSPQFLDENDTDSNFQPALCTEDVIASALQHGHLTASQAYWLHEHQVNWQISVE